jgi:hypothetical protein
MAQRPSSPQAHPIAHLPALSQSMNSKPSALGLVEYEDFQWGAQRSITDDVLRQFRLFLTALTEHEPARAEWFWPAFRESRRFMSSNPDGWPVARETRGGPAGSIISATTSGGTLTATNFQSSDSSRDDTPADAGALRSRTTYPSSSSTFVTLGTVSLGLIL